MKRTKIAPRLEAVLNAAVATVSNEDWLLARSQFRALVAVAREAAKAPGSDDRCACATCAPVLHHALDRLRRLSAPVAKSERNTQRYRVQRATTATRKGGGR